MLLTKDRQQQTHIVGAIVVAVGGGGGEGKRGIPYNRQPISTIQSMIVLCRNPDNTNTSQKVSCILLSINATSSSDMDRACILVHVTSYLFSSATHLADYQNPESISSLSRSQDVAAYAVANSSRYSRPHRALRGSELLAAGLLLHYEALPGLAAYIISVLRLAIARDDRQRVHEARPACGGVAPVF